MYVAIPTPPERLGECLAAVRALGFLGVNVTVPHKEKVLPFCDTLAGPAERVGAVNTIVVGRDGRLVGYNTDVAGFSAALGEAGVPPTGRAVVLGAGGAARAVLVALGERGISPFVVARNARSAEQLKTLGAVEVLPWTAAALAKAFAGATLVVDATSAGLDAAGEAALPAPLPIELLDSAALVCSLLYHREPGWLAAARSRGLRTKDGVSMLVHQAAAAFTLMTGRPAPLAAMRAVM